MWQKFCKVSLVVGWALWLAAMAWFTAGMLRYVPSADATLTPITLTPGQTARAEVYRIREAPLWMEARFGGPMGRKRPELGEHTTRLGAPGAVAEPGEPVRIRVRDGGDLDVVMVAAPRSSASSTHFYRKLWPESHIDGTLPETPPPPFRSWQRGLRRLPSRWKRSGRRFRASRSNWKSAHLSASSVPRPAGAMSPHSFFGPSSPRSWVFGHWCGRG